MNVMERLYQILEEEQMWDGEILLKRHEYLCSAGQVEPRLFFVKEGSLRVFVTQQEEEHTIRLGYPGSFLAALDSFIAGQPTGFHIQAIKSASLYFIDGERYRAFLQEDEERRRLWQQAMELLILQQLERECDLLIEPPRERYLRVLKRSPQLFQHVPNRYIASYLRMTPETFSRIKKS
ncbi:MAG: Crp/Fnr family transcriptional regulator [Flavobacteriales bacterium]|nr:Crp/Fnr family transcriptional regulator [Flavobacteriales bacterium]